VIEIAEKMICYTQMYLAYELKKVNLQHMPIQVSIEPTNICNFRCRFCNQSSPNHFSKRPAGMIDLTDYELLLHKIRKTCKSVKTLSLTLDGEPLLHKHLPQMIKKANEMSFFVRFSSNGYKINRSFLEKTKYLSYLISIDFCLDKDEFEKHRGKKGSWAIIFNNLREMVNYIKINKHFRLEIYENSGYYEKLNKVQSNLKILKEHFGKMPRLTYGLRSYHKIVNGRTLDFSNSKYYGCLYPWTSLNITWNGDVVTCCRDLDGEYVLGNILKSSIEDVWNGQKYLYLREAILKNNLRMIASCRSCDLPYDRQRNRWRYKMQKALQKW
jgi:radical SAM protein with 4Fe4S-binding SPASM domain